MTASQGHTDPTDPVLVRINMTKSLQDRRERMENALRELQFIFSDDKYKNAQDAGASLARQVADLKVIIDDQLHQVCDDQRKAVTFAMYSFEGQDAAFVLNRMATHSSTNEWDDEDKKLCESYRKDFRERYPASKAGPSNIQLQFQAFDVLNRERAAGGGKMAGKRSQGGGSTSNRPLTPYQIAKEACKARHGGKLPTDRKICWCCDSLSHMMKECPEPNKFGIFSLPK